MRKALLLLAVISLFLIPAAASAGGLVVYDAADRASTLGALQQLDVDVRLTDSAADITEHRRYTVLTDVPGQKLGFYRPTDANAESLRITVGEEDVPIVVIGGGYSLLRRQQLLGELREPGVLRGVGQPLAESARFTTACSNATDAWPRVLGRFISMLRVRLALFCIASGTLLHRVGD